jgi:membrane peptidoglycan carboxypeptidase
VTTTIDLDLQAKAQAALETWISEFEASASGHNGALVAIDPETSELLVMVGSRDYFRDDIQGRNNNATADNSPGSTLKPFAYAAAFEQLNWGTETEILDTPVSFPDGDQAFVPRNPSGNFQGPISVRKALGNSLNIPATKTAAYVGVANVAAEYKKFGITGLEDQQEGFGPALVVGGIDVNLLDVTYAYTVFANSGVMRGVPTTQDLPPGNRELDPVSILQVVRESDGEILYPDEEDHRVKVQERRVIDARYAWMINDILSDPNAHCITYGCGALSIGREWGVKTGTSEPYENSRAIGETWTYGYTPDLVAGVWAGNADNSPMYNITSTSISYRALRDFMIEALKDVPAREFPKPPGLKETETCTPSGLKATPECPRKVKQWLPDTLDLEEDNWWRRAKVDIRDGLLATELTPPQFVSERFGMVIPESVQGFARAQALEWQRLIGGTSTPTDKSTGNAPVRIDSPKSGAFVKNNVRITGKADSEHFVAYRVEWGAGSQPSEWNVLVLEDDPESGGELAEWDVRELDDGVYTIRLVLLDSVQGTLYYPVTVNVGENRRSSTPVPTPTPSFSFD